MSKKTVFLDFTSLLDVVLIILFFFIIFSHLETEDVKAKLEGDKQTAVQQAEDREKAAQELLDEAEALFEEAEAKEAQADTLLSEAELAKIRSGENIKGIKEFYRNQNIRVNLRMIDGKRDWRLDIFKGDEKIASAPKADISAMSGTFKDALEAAGCKKDDTLLVTFIYDASEAGTNSAWADVEKVFSDVKNEYEHFFYSEIDESVFRED